MAIPLTIPSCHLGPLENGGWISLGVKQAVGERRKMCHRESAWQVSFSKTGAGGEHKGAPSWIGSKARTVKINYKTKIFFIKANLHQTKAPPSWWEWTDVWPGTNFRFWDPWNFFFLLRWHRRHCLESPSPSNTTKYKRVQLYRLRQISFPFLFFTPALNIITYL